MIARACLRDIEIRLGRISYLKDGEWLTRPVTAEDIRLYNRDKLITAIASAVGSMSSFDAPQGLQLANYLRRLARERCYAQNEDLGLIFDTVITLCKNFVCCIWDRQVEKAIAEKCKEHNRDDLIVQYHTVQEELSSYLNHNDTIFTDYIERLSSTIGLPDDEGVIPLAKKLGYFPLFYAINQLLARIEPKLADVARNRLCIFNDNIPLNEEETLAVAKYYSMVKYRLDAIIRCISDDIEPLIHYWDIPMDEINVAENTSFSTSFHHYICFRLIPNVHYYGSLRSRTPDWVFTTKGREIFSATLHFAKGINRVLDEASLSVPSLALTLDKGDIRFCFDDIRHKLMYGESFGYSLSDGHSITAKEAREKFKNTSSEQIIIPESVLNECNRMLSLLGTGKRIVNYILEPCPL